MVSGNNYSFVAHLPMIGNHRIGEKFLAWTEEDPSLDTILTSVSLYWLTDTFPRSIYPYRDASIPRGYAIDQQLIQCYLSLDRIPTIEFAPVDIQILHKEALGIFILP